jgi:hypothetical protein
VNGLLIPAVAWVVVSHCQTSYASSDQLIYSVHIDVMELTGGDEMIAGEIDFYIYHALWRARMSYRVGSKGLLPLLSSHTTVRAVRHTAVH